MIVSHAFTFLFSFCFLSFGSKYCYISAGEANQYYQQQPPPQMRPQPQSQRNELNYGMRELRYKVAASAAARK